MSLTEEQLTQLEQQAAEELDVRIAQTHLQLRTLEAARAVLHSGTPAAIVKDEQ